jgi:hypothetical protein
MKRAILGLGVVTALILLSAGPAPWRHGAVSTRGVELERGSSPPTPRSSEEEKEAPISTTSVTVDRAAAERRETHIRPAQEGKAAPVAADPSAVVEGGITRGQIAPERGPMAPQPPLSEEEREALITSTRVEVDRFFGGRLDEKATEAKDEGRTRRAAPVDAVGALDALLREASRDDSPAMSDLLRRLLELPSAHLRITALHWLAARPDVAADALARALRDGDGTVRTVAIQLLFERGVSDEDLAQLEADAETDVEGLRDRIAILVESTDPRR